MLNPPTFGVPVTIPEGGLLQRRRWSLYPDRLVRESQEVLWGYSPDASVMLGDVRLVYAYDRARPANLFWGVLGIPFFIVAVVLAKEPGANIGVMVFLSIGLGFLLLAGVLGFVRRPHVTIQTSRETVSIGMDRPWWSGTRRRTFFNGLAQILGIPDLLPGGGVRRMRPRDPEAPPQIHPAPVVSAPPHAPGLNAGSPFGELTAPPPQPPAEHPGPPPIIPPPA